MANINPADLAVDKYEAASTIKGLMKSGRPEDVQSAAPYVDAKGEIDFNSPRFMGLMASIAESNKDYAKTMVDLGDIAVRRSAVEAQKAETQARLKDPRLQEYERIHGIARERAKASGTSEDVALKSMFSEDPDLRRTYEQGVFGMHKEPEVDAMDALKTKLVDQLTAGGIDLKKNPEKLTQAIRQEFEANPTKYGFDSKEKVKKVFLSSSPKARGEIRKWVEEEWIRPALLEWNPDEAKKLGRSLKDEGVPPTSKTWSQLEAKLPGVSKAYDAVLDKQWTEGRTVDKGKALDEAIALMEKSRSSGETADKKFEKAIFGPEGVKTRAW
jgi:hypothetical protein